jgi:small subunit ribosomal protein S1
MNQFEPGQQIETTIVAITGDTVFINLGLKTDGFIDKAEFVDADGKISVKEGDSVTAYFLSAAQDELHFTTRIGSKTRKGALPVDQMLEHAFKNDIAVTGRVEKEIKGGYEVVIGSTHAFCPYSQMGYRNKEESAAYVGKQLTFHIQEYKNEGRTIVVSNKVIEEAIETDHLKKVEETVKEGSTVTGTIISLQKYGAFVSIDGFQALLPISEITHSHIDDVSSLLSVGQTIQAKVIKTDWEHKRVSLSMRELEQDPWQSVAAQFPVGTKLTGTISRVAEFGIFITLAPGIDGLLHISTLDTIDRNTNIHQIYKTGTPFNVAVDKIDINAHRISLRPAQSAEQEETAEKYMAGQNASDSDTYNPFAALLKK